MAWECLQDVLKTIDTSRPSRGLPIYPVGNTSTPTALSYRSLYVQAKKLGRKLQLLDSYKCGSPVLLHLEDHWDIILWYCAILLVDGLPVISSPFSHITEHRKSHIQHLSPLFVSSICIIRTKLIHMFGKEHCLKLYSIESLLDRLTYQRATRSMKRRNDDLAILMLTSGSTGNAKAVQLTHKQVLAAVSGKASVRQLPRDKPFLNWIGLDHVASLVEIHLQALYLGVDQIHVHAVDVVASPSTFLDLLSHHQVSRSFIPKFFLGKIVSVVRSKELQPHSTPWDLRYLSVLASGGEANDAETCVQASSLLVLFGAPKNVITPGFGMTETCAGAIFNLDCPSYELPHELSYASLGNFMKGIEMRADTSGHLETASFGPAIFGIIDAEGNLTLASRANETFNINGIKFNASGVQALVEQVVGTKIRYLVTFASRSTKSHTEQVIVIYLPKEQPITAQELVDIDDSIIKAVMTLTSIRPFVFAFDDEALLPKSTIGKISKAKARILFEDGFFAEQIELHDHLIENQRSRTRTAPANTTEALLLADIAEDPVVTLRPTGPKIPLWLIHSGVGEILVFLPLTQHLPSRPIYALHAHGFDGEPPFPSIAAAVETYYAAIKRRQPHGPYAIAGYSYGGMLAFELGKQLEAEGAEVKFLATFNLPPHIKTRMRQLSWNLCLLHLTTFLELISQARADAFEDSLAAIRAAEAVETVLVVADEGCMVDLALSPEGLMTWADVAFGLQSMAVEYEPAGRVGRMDVFHAVPLKIVARSREEWVRNHLGRWGEFCGDVRLHEVGGEHYTVLGPEHVGRFAEVLERALVGRGV
ncbi:acetyl-CoA synthetase-like protein [Patellaria atrata CBS 101060]|uniref:Acetyl-CoA synthetase-like protein n=1 Tax=Patellaria atrata CBS 101060 TaxID=1346257 RepID=A0A9P4VN60_9PEZI|nr:acetyl-CoA synthetase-like protein [Patellaria atrata CBS 101060]